MFKAKKYDKIYPDRSKEIDFLSKYLKGKIVLDIGGGTGVISEALNKKGFVCWNIEPQKGMAELSIDRDVKTINSSIEDTSELEKRDIVFDNAIMVFHVFNFLTNPEKAFDNIAKILKGRLIFSYWNNEIKESGWKFNWRLLRLSRKRWLGNEVEIDLWFPFFHEKHIMKVYKDEYIKGLLKNFKIVEEIKTKFTTIIVAEI